MKFRTVQDRLWDALSWAGRTFYRDRPRQEGPDIVRLADMVHEAFSAVEESLKVEHPPDFNHTLPGKTCFDPVREELEEQRERGALNLADASLVALLQSYSQVEPWALAGYPSLEKVTLYSDLMYFDPTSVTGEERFRVSASSPVFRIGSNLFSKEVHDVDKAIMTLDVFRSLSSFVREADEPRLPEAWERPPTWMVQATPFRALTRNRVSCTQVFAQVPVPRYTQAVDLLPIPKLIEYQESHLVTGSLSGESSELKGHILSYRKERGKYEYLARQMLRAIDLQALARIPWEYYGLNGSDLMPVKPYVFDVRFKQGLEGLMEIYGINILPGSATERRMETAIETTLKRISWALEAFPCVYTDSHCKNFWHNTYTRDETQRIGMQYIIGLTKANDRYLSVQLRDAKACIQRCMHSRLGPAEMVKSLEMQVVRSVTGAIDTDNAHRDLSSIVFEMAGYSRDPGRYPDKILGEGFDAEAKGELEAMRIATMALHLNASIAAYLMRDLGLEAAEQGQGASSEFQMRKVLLEEYGRQYDVLLDASQALIDISYRVISDYRFVRCEADMRILETLKQEYYLKIGCELEKVLKVCGPQFSPMLAGLGQVSGPLGLHLKMSKQAHASDYLHSWERARMGYVMDTIYARYDLTKSVDLERKAFATSVARTRFEMQCSGDWYPVLDDLTRKHYERYLEEGGVAATNKNVMWRMDCAIYEMDLAIMGGLADVRHTLANLDEDSKTRKNMEEVADRLAGYHTAIKDDQTIQRDLEGVCRGLEENLAGTPAGTQSPGAWFELIGGIREQLHAIADDIFLRSLYYNIRVNAAELEERSLSYPLDILKTYADEMLPTRIFSSPEACGAQSIRPGSLYIGSAKNSSSHVLPDREDITYAYVPVCVPGAGVFSSMSSEEIAQLLPHLAGCAPVAQGTRLSGGGYLFPDTNRVAELVPGKKAVYVNVDELTGDGGSFVHSDIYSMLLDVQDAAWRAKIPVYMVSQNGGLSNPVPIRKFEYQQLGRLMQT